MSLVENRESATRDAPWMNGLNISVKPRLALQNAMDHPVFFIPVFFDLNGYFSSSMNGVPHFQTTPDWIFRTMSSFGWSTMLSEQQSQK